MARNEANADAADKPAATGTGAPVRAMVDLPLDVAAAFDVVLEELAASLETRGLMLEARPRGRVSSGDVRVGTVSRWERGEGAAIEWRPHSPGAAPARVDIGVEPLGAGARVVIEVRGSGALPEGGAELAGWFASAVGGPLVAAPSPAALGDWITDRQARRPSGSQSRAVYRDPLYHYPNFRVILDELALGPSDRLLDVGCGGGAMLRLALASGCRAAGIDHSPDMVHVARELNADAIAAGRLEVARAEAGALPFAPGTFTCAAMTGVLGFLADPVGALAELRRVLAPGGRAVILGSDPELRGTPGAPEPFASRLRFYDDGDLASLGRDAGFEEVRVVRRTMEEHARAAGVPEEHVPLFGEPGARFLLLQRAATREGRR